CYILHVDSYPQQMEMAGPSSSSNPRMMKRKAWGGLRQRWKLLGVFEIDQQHEFYLLTCMMKEGLAAAVQNTIDNPIPNELSEDDYQLEVTQIHKDFRMETFAGPVFASLRRSLGMTEKEYQHSLSSEGCYLQFISNSKSKANFFLTHDKRFFLKTQSRREIRFLLSHLKHYMEHLEKYPHSLLVKFLGERFTTVNVSFLHSYFIVMQSVFYPDERIFARYDIKGCELSRWTDPAPEGSQVVVVLKDLNFEGNFVTLGNAILVSVNTCSSAAVPGVVPEDDSTIQATELDSETSLRGKFTETSQAEFGGQNEGASKAGSELAELQEFQAQNRRLLPNFKNPIHVIDGPEQRYFIGIIDIFTVYGFKKKLEHLWKSLRHPGQRFSTVSPPAYCLRLCQWVQDHTK
ncbi:hypothetical protein QTP86_023726, partial [Hemibagrus guttatus]